LFREDYSQTGERCSVARVLLDHCLPNLGRFVQFPLLFKSDGFGGAGIGGLGRNTPWPKQPESHQREERARNSRTIVPGAQCRQASSKWKSCAMEQTAHASMIAQCFRARASNWGC